MALWRIYYLGGTDNAPGQELFVEVSGDVIEQEKAAKTQAQAYRDQGFEAFHRAAFRCATCRGAGKVLVTMPRQGTTPRGMLVLCETCAGRGWR